MKDYDCDEVLDIAVFWKDTSLLRSIAVGHIPDDVHVERPISRRQ